jgi:hypothetical protein
MTGRPDNFALKFRLMYRFLYLSALLLILACGRTGTPAETASASDPHRALLAAADSLIQILERRMVSAEGEFDQLKLRNMRDILRENRESLARVAWAEGADQGVMEDTQADYLRSLLIAAEALLSDNPLSVGKWEGEVRPVPDSVPTPVGRTP